MANSEIEPKDKDSYRKIKEKATMYYNMLDETASIETRKEVEIFIRRFWYGIQTID